MKKSMKFLLAAVAVVLGMTSCDIVGVPDNASGKFVVKINTEDMVLAPGETASRPSTNAAATTTYTSSDPAVATVDNAGLVKAVAEGTCVITVSTPFLATKTIEGDEILSTATAEYKVIVAKKAGSISFAEAAINKEPGDDPFTNELTVVGDGKVTFASSDADVATVDAEGKVTIKAEGTATITATVEDSKTYKYETNTASFTLTVAPAVNPNAYLKWDGTQKKLVETPIPAEAIVVTPTTLTPGVSLTCLEAVTFVITGEVTLGKITLKADVNLIIKDGAKLTVNQIDGYNGKNLSIYGQSVQTDRSGQLVVNSSSGSAIMNITTLEVHGCQVTATSSTNDKGGFNWISIFNVYGGSVYAEHTGDTNGYGISLNGSMNIYGGEVTAVGKGSSNDYSYGITAISSSDVTVYGGKLSAWNASNKALSSDITLKQGTGFSGRLYISNDNVSWLDFDFVGEFITDSKYVKVE